MIIQEYPIERKERQQINIRYKFTLKGNTEFEGRFSQPSITISPESLNGTSVDIVVENIMMIRRVDDPGWPVSHKLKYFIFELNNGAKIAGLPNCKVLPVSVTFIENCKVECENILKIEKMTGDG